MTDFNLRPAVSSDINTLVSFDHGFSTDHVWQMGYHDNGGTVGVRFQEVRLPRPMQVAYPRRPAVLVDEWTNKAAVLVAEREEALAGYLVLTEGPAPGSAWLTDLVVDVRFRRQGAGTALLRAAQSWARQHGYDSLFLEMQSKNYPAICLARKLGYSFTGYSDNYFPDGDIALFFLSRL